MALTIGTGPFGQKPAGRFNFEPPRVALYWDDYPKRIRAQFNGVTVADSRRVKALHETGHLMVLYFPRDDVDLRHLEATSRRTTCPHKGEASYWSVHVGERTAQNAVWSYEDPKPSVAPIAGYMAFVYEQMDAWLQEDEPIYAHPRDPYHRVDVHRCSRHVVVRHRDTIVAESARPYVLFETGLPPVYYLHPDEVRTDLLVRSDLNTECPYKGGASHWHLEAVDGSQVDNAAWSLPEPFSDAAPLSGHFAFYPKKVRIDVDGDPPST